MSVLIGGRQITAADVHSIASGSSLIVIDPPALEATKRRAADLANAEANKSGKGGKGKGGGAAAESKSAESSADPSSIPSSLSDASSSTVYSLSESRAILTVKLAQILEGRSGIRGEVAVYLCALLNNKITPLLPRSSNDRTILQHIAALFFPLSISGSRLVRVGDQIKSYEAAVQSSAISPPTLNIHDYAEFISGVAPSVGLLSLEFSAFSSYVPLADVIAALTLETISAHTEPFSQDHHEVARPHKGSKEVAANLRWLMENSKFAGNSKRSEQDSALFRYIPHYHGPARDAVDHAARVVRVELHAAELTPSGTSSRHAGPFHPAPINSAAAHLTLVALQLANYSAQRSQEIIQNGAVYGFPASFLTPKANAEKNIDGGVPDWSSLLTSIQNKIEGARNAMESLHKPSSSDASSILSVLRKANDALLESLSFESLITNQVLAILNDEAVAASEAAQAKKEAAAKKREEELKAAGKPIPSQPPRPKEIKGIQLGNGTAKWRSFLTSTDAVPGSSAGIGAFQLIHNQQSAQRILSSLIAHFDAFNSSSSSVYAEVERLLASANQKSKPKIARGTRDSEPEQITIREKCFSIIRSVFLKHGAVGIDTPVFELRETLMGKYGEDSKLIYDLADQGGEALSLRYDLTVPFARYVAMHQADHIKRYHIAKVYRRDNPAMARGRFREFYQCDLDIAGNYAPMVPDAEVLKVLVDILDQLQVGGYAVKLNHRNLLDGLMEVCGVPAEKFRAICSSIDKLDKESWSDVREEMVAKKGLSAESADKIGKYVKLKAETGNPRPLLNDLKSLPEFASNERAQKAFADLALLFDYLEDLGALSKISFDMSLARGLDYYTGVIYEAVLTDTDRVGSIAAGGRYDNLVGMFSSKQVPAVGVSIGIERLLTILEELERKRGAIRKNATHVLVCSATKNLLRERMKLANKLWEAGVNAEYLYDANPRADRQMEYALENYIPITVWIGEDEIKKGVVGVRNMRNREQVNVENAMMMNKIQELLLENERLGPMPIYVPEKKDKTGKAETEKKE